LLYRLTRFVIDRKDEVLAGWGFSLWALLAFASGAEAKLNRESPGVRGRLSTGADTHTARLSPYICLLAVLERESIIDA
jgi:hypothetical protein